MIDRLPRLARRLIAVAILGVLLTAGYLGMAQPVWQKFRGYEESISQNQELIQRFNEAIIDPDSLEQQRAEATRSNASQAGMLRGSNDAVAAAFVQQFVTSAVEAESGTMRSIQILPAVEQGGFRRIAIRAQMNLTTAALRGTLYRIETSQPFMFVTNLDVRQGPQIQHSSREYSESPLLVRLDVYGFIRQPAPATQGS